MEEGEAFLWCLVGRDRCAPGHPTMPGIDSTKDYVTQDVDQSGVEEPGVPCQRHRKSEFQSWARKCARDCFPVVSFLVLGLRCTHPELPGALPSKSPLSKIFRKGRTPFCA